MKAQITTASLVVCLVMSVTASIPFLTGKTSVTETTEIYADGNEFRNTELLNRNPYAIFGNDGLVLMTEQERTLGHTLEIPNADKNDGISSMELDSKTGFIRLFDKDGKTRAERLLDAEQRARWFTQDRFAEKYYSHSPYSYAVGNPIRYIDINGDSLGLTGTQEDLAATIDVMNNGVGINVASIDGQGLVTVRGLSSEELASLTPEQAAMFDLLSNVASTETAMTSLGIVNNSENVFVGSWETSQVDIADVLAFGTGEGGNMYSSLGHEIAEQQYKQTGSSPNPSYAIGHISYGLPAEDRISGYTRGRSTQTSTQIHVPYTNQTGTVTLIIDVNRGNISNITRRK